MCLSVVHNHHLFNCSLSRISLGSPADRLNDFSVYFLKIKKRKAKSLVMSSTDKRRKDKKKGGASPPIFSENATEQQARHPSGVLSKFLFRKNILMANFFDFAGPGPASAGQERKNELDKSEELFLMQFENEIKKADCRFLMETPREVYNALPPKEIRLSIVGDSLSRAPLTHLEGPTKESSQSKYLEWIAAESISTYPWIPGDLHRNGDPICDHWCVEIFDNRVIVALSDGCGWGEHSRKAAYDSSTAFVDYLRMLQRNITNFQEGGHYLLRALCHSHNRILESVNDPLEAGCATLAGGILLQTCDNLWTFISTCVGDCKIFHFSQRAQTVTDVTAFNRIAISDPSDPGGRIGPYVEGSCPDLRNLSLFVTECSADDILFLVSDGVHDNLDPENLGISPNLLGASRPSWSEIESDEARLLKKVYMENMFCDIVLASIDPKGSGQVLPQLCVKKLLENAFNITVSSRKFVEEGLGTRLPLDHDNYPGKCDHTTAVAFKVNDYRSNIIRLKPEDVHHESSSSSSSSSPSSSPSTLISTAALPSIATTQSQPSPSSSSSLNLSAHIREVVPMFASSSALPCSTTSHPHPPPSLNSGPQRARWNGSSTPPTLGDLNQAHIAFSGKKLAPIFTSVAETSSHLFIFVRTAARGELSVSVDMRSEARVSVFLKMQPLDQIIQSNRVSILLGVDNLKFSQEDSSHCFTRSILLPCRVNASSKVSLFLVSSFLPISFNPATDQRFSSVLRKWSMTNLLGL